MPINPAIALGVKGIELQDPLAQYGRVAAIQQAQQQNALANMQMQEYERARQEEQGIRNRLAAGAKLEDPETFNFLLGSKSGRDILKQQADFQKAQTEEAARRAKLMADTEAMYRNMAGQISNKADAASFLQRMLSDPALKNAPITTIPLEQQIQRIPEDPQGLDNWVKQFALGTTKWITENKPVTQQINRMGQTDIVQLPGLGGAPTTVGTYADVPLPAGVEAQKSRIAKAGATTIDMRQETEFEKGLGAGQSKRVLDSRAAAEDAAEIMRTNQVGREILKSGAITGAGANFFVGLNTALKQAGIDFGYADAAANSQAYAANMAQNVGKLIKQYGAGTGLSDADRDYATQAAGGKINLDEKAISKILDINDRAANYIIDKHNKSVKNIKTNVPLTVEKPVFQQIQPADVGQIPGQGAAPAAIPQAAIDALKSGRGTDAQFDEIFGPGAAKRVRGGK